MKTLLAFLFLTSAPCFATLGQDRSSVHTDLARLPGAVMVAVHSVGAHPEIKVDTINNNGQMFKQFSDASGQIFAITWSGLNQPDLTGFFAGYFSEFKRLEDATPKGRRYPIRPVITSEITVIRGGHLQDIRGVAYVNNRIPSGVNLEDLK